MKKFIAILLVFALILSFAACGKKGDDGTVDIGVLKGTTGLGAVPLMDKSPNNYNFTVMAEPTDAVARLTNGTLDISALPTNVAASLYNKTGDIEIIAINTLGVLYILENGNSLGNISDLRGKTVYANGQGANPEYVLNYILRQNGLEPGTDVEIIFKDPSEIAALMASGEAEICMLPVPHSTTVLMNNLNVRTVFDLTKEYKRVTDNDSVFTMGCVVARRDFIEAHPDAVDEFLTRYKKSIDDINGDPEKYADAVVKHEITGSAEVAKAAVPSANMVCITGSDMFPALNGYYNVLFEADSASIGGALPDDGFYYVP